MIVSRWRAQSPAMLPRAHIACSTIPTQFDRSSLTKSGIPPLSTTDWHWLVDPEATFASAHVASSWSCGNCSCFVYKTNFGINPQSMIGWMGGSS